MNTVFHQMRQMLSHTMTSLYYSAKQDNLAERPKCEESQLLHAKMREHIKKKTKNKKQMKFSLRTRH